MTGIENITGRIQADAQAEIDRIDADARAQADKITAAYAARAERECADILERGAKAPLNAETAWSPPPRWRPAR